MQKNEDLSGGLDSLDIFQADALLEVVATFAGLLVGLRKLNVIFQSILFLLTPGWWHQFLVETI